MSLHPAVKDVVVNVGVHYDHHGTGDPVVKALVSLRNPWDECEALLEEIKAFTNGIYIQICLFLLLPYSQFLFFLFIITQREFRKKK